MLSVGHMFEGTFQTIGKLGLGAIAGYQAYKHQDDIIAAIEKIVNTGEDTHKNLKTAKKTKAIIDKVVDNKIYQQLSKAAKSFVDKIKNG